MDPATVVESDVLDARQRERYSRQMQLPGFGIEGQRQLASSTVLVTGVGGLGGTVALYLAAAGIGGLILVRGGTLRLDDLNRQILMRDDGVGQPRVHQAAETILRFNPACRIEAIAESISDDNVSSLVSKVTMAVDATHNFEERYRLNDACVTAGVPMVEAAMDGMEAQLTTVIPGRTPCLRCRSREAPPWDRRGFAVLGAVSGALACLAALEVVKQLTGCGPPLIGELARLDLNDLRLRRLQLQRDPRCPCCSKTQTTESNHVHSTD